jgi:hypothetical protein
MQLALDGRCVRPSPYVYDITSKVLWHFDTYSPLRLRHFRRVSCLPVMLNFLLMFQKGRHRRHEYVCSRDSGLGFCA